jgi:hypothetical protein
VVGDKSIVREKRKEKEKEKKRERLKQESDQVSVVHYKHLWTVRI